MLPTFIELGGGKLPPDLEVDGVSIAPLLRGQSRDSRREWICALGHGPAKLDANGVRGKADFTTRVIRDKRFKVWVSNNRKIARLHDLEQDPWEKNNLIESKEAIHQEALAKFGKVIAGMPEKDARPLYTPRAANPWDKRLKARKN